MKKILPVIGFVSMFLILAGCAPSRLAMDYGTSYNLARFNQVLDPAAEKNLQPVSGFDGEAAQEVMARYRQGFEKAAPSAGYGPMFTIRGITPGVSPGR